MQHRFIKVIIPNYTDT